MCVSVSVCVCERERESMYAKKVSVICMPVYQPAFLSWLGGWLVFSVHVSVCV